MREPLELLFYNFLFNSVSSYDLPLNSLLHKLSLLDACALRIERLFCLAEIVFLIQHHCYLVSSSGSVQFVGVSLLVVANFFSVFAVLSFWHQNPLLYKPLGHKRQPHQTYLHWHCVSAGTVSSD